MAVTSNRRRYTFGVLRVCQSNSIAVEQVDKL